MTYHVLLFSFTDEETEAQESEGTCLKITQCWKCRWVRASTQPSDFFHTLLLNFLNPKGNSLFSRDQLWAQGNNNEDEHMNNSCLLLTASYLCHAHFTTCQVLYTCHPHETAGNRCYYSLLTDEEFRDQRGQAICLRPRIQQRAETAFEPRAIWLQWHLDEMITEMWFL